jgi:hypothetical protein
MPLQQPERTGLMSWLAPMIVLVVALGVRSWYLVELTDSGRNDAPLGVQDDRSGRIKDQLGLLKDEKDFVSDAPWSATPERTAHEAPGYLFFVFALNQLPVDLEQAVRWTQCALGAFAAMFYCLLARYIFRGQAIGMLAGLFCALHPFWVINTAEFNDGVLASFLLALCLLLGTIGGRSGGPLTSVVFGLMLALLAMVRAALLPFAFVGLLWYLWQCRTVSRSWLSAALAFLGFINGLAPWCVRNLQDFHDVFPVVDST